MHAQKFQKWTNQVRLFRMASILSLLVDDSTTKTMLVLGLWWLKRSINQLLTCVQEFSDITIVAGAQTAYVSPFSHDFHSALPIQYVSTLRRA